MAEVEASKRERRAGQGRAAASTPGPAPGQGALGGRAGHARLRAWVSGVPETAVNSTCGALAGAASGLVTCPLDVIKTKLQAQGSFRRGGEARLSHGGVSTPYHGMLPTARMVWAQDGLRGFYRGLTPMLIGYLPTWAVYMGVYGVSRDYFYMQIDTKWLAQMCASVTAGACSTLATNPIWVIKTRLMSQVGAAASKDSRTPWHYRNTVDAFRQMYAAEGMRAFYSGLAPALLGLSHVAIQFPLYEFFKLHFTGLEMGDSSSRDSHSLAILGATFLSKVCATCATYPHEVLRTRLQTQQRPQRSSSPRSRIGPLRSHGVSPSLRQSPPERAGGGLRYEGVISTCRTILKEEGWRAFYYGMGTNLFRAVPSAMTTMITYETLKRAVQRLQEEGAAAED